MIPGSTDDIKQLFAAQDRRKATACAAPACANVPDYLVTPHVEGPEKGELFVCAEHLVSFGLSWPVWAPSTDSEAWTVEILTPGVTVIVLPDGDQWCVAWPDFVNLQESPCEFDTEPNLAIDRLILNKGESKEATDQSVAVPVSVERLRQIEHNWAAGMFTIATTDAERLALVRMALAYADCRAVLSLLARSATRLAIDVDRTSTSALSTFEDRLSRAKSLLETSRNPLPAEAGK